MDVSAENQSRLVRVNEAAQFFATPMSPNEYLVLEFVWWIMGHQDAGWFEQLVQGFLCCTIINRKSRKRGGDLPSDPNEGDILEYHLSFIKIRCVTRTNPLIDVKRVDITRDCECLDRDLIQKIRRKLPWSELGDVPADDDHIRGM